MTTDPRTPARRQARRRVRLLTLGLPALTCLALLASGGAAAASPTGAPAAAPRVDGFSTPVSHIVYIIMENHSFDNVLGYWCATTDRCDGATSGEIAGGTTIPLTRASDIVVNVGHQAADQLTAIDGGKMDGFSQLFGCTVTSKYACYSQYLPSQIPNIVAMAAAFDVSDHTFGDGPNPSWGMHVDAVTANMDGFTGANPAPGVDGTLGSGWGCDSGYDAPWVSPLKVNLMVPACVPDPALNPVKYPYGGAYRATPVQHVPTILDELQSAGLSWKIYGGLGGSDNGNGYGWTICPSFADCLYTNQAANLVSNNKVVTDARSGNLPNFSIVTPTQADSTHNFDSMEVGDDWLGQVVGAIEHGPEWDSTAVFLTWDDCGCFYDHVVPPAGDSVRIPMIIVSPYAIAAHTDSTDATFASVLAFTEKDFHLPALAALDAGSYDYSGSFNFSQRPLPPVPLVARTIPQAERRYLAAHPAPPDDT